VREIQICTIFVIHEKKLTAVSTLQLINHATLQRNKTQFFTTTIPQPCNATIMQLCNATITQPCNATITQRNNNATLQRNTHATLQTSEL
jgi:hypothetical protein